MEHGDYVSELMRIPFNLPWKRLVNALDETFVCLYSKYVYTCGALPIKIVSGGVSEVIHFRILSFESNDWKKKKEVIAL